MFQRRPLDPSEFNELIGCATSIVMSIMLVVEIVSSHKKLSNEDSTNVWTELKGALTSLKQLEHILDPVIKDPDE